jgi:hypothetical protein
MAKKTTVSGLAAGVLLAYHLLSLVKDAESWETNRKRYRADPSTVNLLRLLLAEGVFIKDLGLL